MRSAQLLLVVVLVATVLVTPAGAVTAGEVLGKMTDKEQFGYITGAIDMIMYLEQFEARGSTPRSACILKWYYGKDAPGPKQVIAMFDSYRDKPAVGLIKILIDRACRR